MNRTFEKQLQGLVVQLQAISNQVGALNVHDYTTEQGSCSDDQYQNMECRLDDASEFLTKAIHALNTTLHQTPLFPR